MKDEILAQINNPKALEQLYRSNKNSFRKSFGILYPELKGNTAADFWNERLSYEQEDLNWGSGKELMLVIIASFIAWLIAKIPAIAGISEDYFYPRNIGFIVLPLITMYFAWKNKISAGKIAFIAVTTLAGIIFINFLPQDRNSNTLILSCIHLVLFLWSILGFAFTGTYQNAGEKRLTFLKYNGDLVVITTLILIAGGLMTAITIGLFSLIGFNIEKFYFDYIAIFGFSAAPIVGTYLTQTNPQLVGRVSPVIARLFSPLVLVMLVIYLIAMLYSSKDPYNDRESLMIFNALLVGVMAIIFFSIAETSKSGRNTMQSWVLFLLSSVTIIVNCIALSAILFRISEWGITPNRAAVLGGNALILIHLILVAVQLFKVVTNKKEIEGITKVIAGYLPVYFFWTIVVTFIFPLIFSFK